MVEARDQNSYPVRSTLCPSTIPWSQSLFADSRRCRMGSYHPVFGQWASRMLELHKAADCDGEEQGSVSRAMTVALNA